MTYEFATILWLFILVLYFWINNRTIKDENEELKKEKFRLNNEVKQLKDIRQQDVEFIKDISSLFDIQYKKMFVLNTNTELMIESQLIHQSAWYEIFLKKIYY